METFHPCPPTEIGAAKNAYAARGLFQPISANAAKPASIIAQVEASGVATAVIVPSIAMWIGELPLTPDTSAK